MYEQFYGLSAPPFQLTPDPRLLFESRDHRRALSYLLYGLQRREGFVIITGQVGTGKTLLLQSLLHDLHEQHLSIARVALANMDAASVLPSVAAAFDIDPGRLSKFELMESLVKNLAPGHSRGSLLIIDEAQACTPGALEELRTIANLQAGGQALVQIFLIGQTELRDVLAGADMAHLRQRVVASHHLKPLNAEEIQSYIVHRLETVGRTGPPYFGSGVFDRVYQWSNGVPRRINLLMDRFLLYGYLEDKTELELTDLEVVIAEFSEEFSDDLMHDGAVNAANGHHEPSPALAELNDRMASLEQTLRGLLGAPETQNLLAHHQIHSERREVVDARMRLAVLESVFSAVDAEFTSAADDVAATPEPTQAGGEEDPAGDEHTASDGAAGDDEPAQPEQPIDDVVETPEPQPLPAETPAAETPESTAAVEHSQTADTQAGASNDDAPEDDWGGEPWIPDEFVPRAPYLGDAEDNTGDANYSEADAEPERLRSIFSWRRRGNG